jgi:hypothetical protein
MEHIEHDTRADTGNIDNQTNGGGEMKCDCGGELIYIEGCGGESVYWCENCLKNFDINYFVGKMQKAESELADIKGRVDKAVDKCDRLYDNDFETVFLDIIKTLKGEA